MDPSLSQQLHTLDLSRTREQEPCKMCTCQLKIFFQWWTLATLSSVVGISPLRIFTAHARDQRSSNQILSISLRMTCKLLFQCQQLSTEITSLPIKQREPITSFLVLIRKLLINSDKILKIWNKEQIRSLFYGQLTLSSTCFQKWRLSKNFKTSLRETFLCQPQCSIVLLLLRSKFCTWTAPLRTLSSQLSLNTPSRKVAFWQVVTSNRDRPDIRQLWVISWLELALDSHLLSHIITWVTTTVRIYLKTSASNLRRSPRVVSLMTPLNRIDNFTQMDRTQLITKLLLNIFHSLEIQRELWTNTHPKSLWAESTLFHLTISVRIHF